MIALLSSLIIFLLLRIPIAYSLGLSALVYFVIFRPQQIVVLPQRLLAGMDSYALIALPLFILMGQLMNASGITTRLVNFCLIFVGRFRGGQDWLMSWPVCCLGESRAPRHRTRPRSAPS